MESPHFEVLWAPRNMYCHPRLLRTKEEEEVQKDFCRHPVQEPGSAMVCGVSALGGRSFPLQ